MKPASLSLAIALGALFVCLPVAQAQLALRFRIAIQSRHTLFLHANPQ